MNQIDAIIALEDGQFDDESGPYDAALAMQAVINGGSGWRMQGSMGRSMMAAIDMGRCMLGREPTHDYYGNFIPSRDQVQAGTKGSRQYVAECNGEEWAAAMEAVE